MKRLYRGGVVVFVDNGWQIALRMSRLCFRRISRGKSSREMQFLCMQKRFDYYHHSSSWIEYWTKRKDKPQCCHWQLAANEWRRHGCALNTRSFWGPVRLRLGLFRFHNYCIQHRVRWFYSSLMYVVPVSLIMTTNSWLIAAFICEGGVMLIVSG